MKKRNNSSTCLSRTFLVSTLVSLLLSWLTIIVQEVKAQNPNRYNLTIKNNTDFEIHRIYISTTETTKWGPDQLGKDYVLANGESFTLKNIMPGEYDIRFVDEDGDECILRNVKIVENRRWSLTTDWLINCINRRR